MKALICRRSLYRWLAHTLIALPVSTTLGAQDSSHVREGQWLTAFSVGVPGYGQEAEPALFTAGANFTQLRPSRPSADFSFGTMPRALMEGVLVLGVRAGVAVPLALSPGVFILPSGGVSLVGAAAGGGGGAAAGVNGGLAAVFLGKNGPGLRVGMTWHRFQETRGAVWLLEIGIVRVGG
jgi:hypothetical protein